MADKKDYYEILGVSREATDEEIKKAIAEIKGGTLAYVDFDV